jgi:Fe-S cluster biogenesis protein NfuA
VNDERSLDTALRRIEELIERLGQLTNPAARAPARELVELILDLHGVALARLMTIVAGADDGTLARLTEDEQVRSILLLHGLHPEDLETRVRRAVERLRPYLGVHGLRLDVVEIAKGTARLKVHPGNGAMPKASVLWTLPSEIEDAIVEAAPDIDKVIIDGLEPPSAVAIASASE